MQRGLRLLAVRGEGDPELNRRPMLQDIKNLEVIESNLDQPVPKVCNSMAFKVCERVPIVVQSAGG